MKTRSIVESALVVLSIFSVFCYASPTEYEISTSTTDGGAPPGFWKGSSRSSLWQEKVVWLRSIIGCVDDDEDFRNNWPKLEPSWRLLLGSFVGFAGSAMGSAGGVGGGGFYLTMLNLFIGFDAKTSTALSKAMVMGAAVSSVVFNVRETHPRDKNLPVIDFSMAVLFQPLLLVGISLGVIFNVMLPEWLITVFLCFLFTQISTGAIRRANELSRQETMRRKAQGCLSLEVGDYVAIASGEEEVASGGGAVSKSPAPLKLMIVWSKTGILLLTFALFLVLQVAKLYVPTCSTWYWIINFLQIPIALGVTLYEAVNHERKQIFEAEVETSVNEEVKSPSRFLKFLLYALYGLGGGIIGGLLGVGGGAIMGPAFLELGLPPQVASSTASFVMVFSSALSVVEYWLLDRLPEDYAIYCILLAMVASLVGQIVIKRVVNATGKASLIVYSLAYSVLASGVVLAVLGANRIYNTWSSGGYMGFNNICKVHSEGCRGQNV